MISLSVKLVLLMVMFALLMANGSGSVILVDLFVGWVGESWAIPTLLIVKYFWSVWKLARTLQLLYFFSLTSSDVLLGRVN